ncbi:N-formylglutamate amidohydrolase [Novosphingobium sp. BW1]|uniref:N-formylglutamate amidohydrolase n=1 Tax=Novosphingobium sp. BW1 TaxID=2592621 RepID=UPI0011DEA91D|nr:N-formylglutamate amidohydrolase [Novosphingobium sp. BW1]TYC86532.1 N-formylglutamate amidohydrolase [Novosphingobium sp. BW1]
MAIPGLESLLGPGDPGPVQCLNPLGTAPFILTGDHAGAAIPARLGSLGLGDDALSRHIAFDIGVAELGCALSRRLDAIFLSQAYSRLVVDCNRDPSSHEAVPETSDGTPVPGNQSLSSSERALRISEIHEPYHARLANEVARRWRPGRRIVLVALHSFTPVLGEFERPWDVGILHAGGNESFSRRLLGAFAREPGLCVGDNQPYHMDRTDYSVPRHAFGRTLDYAEIEIRQDHLADKAGQRHWAELLCMAFEEAWRQ